jgi:thioredoxin 1
MKKVLNYSALIILLFTTSCTNSQNFKSVAVAEFKTALEKNPTAQLIDVRTPGEYAGGYINNAQNIDWNGNDFDTQIAVLDKSKPVLVYCLGGGRSKKAAAKLNALGFIEVIELDGGYLAWTKALPEANATWKGMTKEAYAKLLTSDKVVVIDFYAEWCAPCKKMAPYLEKMNTELADKVIIHRIDADKNKSLFNALGYQGLPVVLVYKNGKETFKKSEFVSEEELRKAL